MGLFERVRTGEIPVPRGSPLPWLLLILVTGAWIATFLVARNRLEDQREKTALALKANDELKKDVEKFKAESADLKQTKDELESAKLERDDAKTKRDELKATLATCQEENTLLKTKPPPRGKK